MGFITQDLLGQKIQLISIYFSFLSEWFFQIGNKHFGPPKNCWRNKMFVAFLIVMCIEGREDVPSPSLPFIIFFLKQMLKIIDKIWVNSRITEASLFQKIKPPCQ